MGTPSVHKPKIHHMISWGELVNSMKIVQYNLVSSMMINDTNYLSYKQTIWMAYKYSN